MTRFLLGTTALTAALVSSGAFAQDATPAAPAATAPADDTVVVVKGIRGSLQSATQIKRKASTFVDSITASDVSTLPDLSVAEALGRVPGVSVTRFQYGGASPDFPAPEGQGNLIRGLGFVRSEFNGRDAFSANGGRALDWSSIPPELVGGVDVYKNSTAQLIEGGIGGTINLRTLEPFDRKGRYAAVTVDGTYTDLAEKWSPSYSAIVSNRWRNGNGEFGLMASYSFSNLQSGINGWQQGAPIPRTTVTSTEAPGADKFTGVPASSIFAINPVVQLRTTEVDRDRESFYLAGQWKNDSMLATVKYLRVRNSTSSIEHTVEHLPDYTNSVNTLVSDMVLDTGWTSPGVALCNAGPPTPDGCEPLIPIGGGLMQSGVLSDEADSWTGAYGLGINTLGVGKVDKALTEDLSFNLKWRPSDQWRIDFDAQYTKSSASHQELWGVGSFWANVYTKSGLDHPEVRFDLDPRNNPSFFAVAGDTYTQPTGTGDPNGAYWLAANDGHQEGTGDLKAVRADAQYEFAQDGWFKDVKFGARFSERKQLNKQNDGNWQGVSPAWAGGYGFFGNMKTTGVANVTEVDDFSNFYRGGVVQGTNHDFVFVNSDLLLNYEAFSKVFNTEPELAKSIWKPRTMDQIFNPDTISDVEENTANLYVQFDFGKEFGNGMSLDGNFGVRYVRSELHSTGQLSYQAWAADEQTASDPGHPRTPDAESHDDARDFLPETAAFIDQASSAQTVNRSEEYWLPSFNVKWNLNDQMLIRFAASKGLTRPNIQDIRAGQRISAGTSRVPYPTVPSTDPLFGVDRGAQDINLTEIRYNGGNPNLKSTTANSFDLSYEWYYKGGMISVAGFDKELQNIINWGDQVLGTKTLDGQTVRVVYGGPVNQAEAKIKGVELAYQQFYDFLPGPLSHLGFQGNFTYIDASAPPPPGFIDANGDGQPDDFGNLFRFGVKNLLGQSKYIVNLVGIYQDDRFEARLAYNWRDQYLTTYRDYMTGNPIFNSAAGFLDGSFKYTLNEHIQFRTSFENILDTKNKARMLLNTQGQYLDRFSFINDRRVVIGVRYQY